MEGAETDGCADYVIIKARLLGAAGLTVKQAVNIFFMIEMNLQVCL